MAARCPNPWALKGYQYLFQPVLKTVGHGPQLGDLYYTLSRNCQTVMESSNAKDREVVTTPSRSQTAQTGLPEGTRFI